MAKSVGYSNTPFWSNYFESSDCLIYVECYYNRHFWPYLVNKFEKVVIFPVFSVPI